MKDFAMSHDPVHAPPQNPPALSARLVRNLVSFCVHRPWLVIMATLLIVGAALTFVARNFDITTDPDALLPPTLPYRVQEAKFASAFPKVTSPIIVVINAMTPELADDAVERLFARLQAAGDPIISVRRPDNAEYFSQNGLLYLPDDDFSNTINDTVRAQLFMGPIARDPSLRGIFDGIGMGMDGVKTGAAKLEDLQKPIASLADTLNAQLEGRRDFFSWRKLTSDREFTPRDLRRIIQIEARQDHTKLRPARATSLLIRAMVSDLQLDEAHGVSVQLTGTAMLADEEFGTLAEHAGLVALLSIAAITLMLWLATRSIRTIIAILVATLAGLVLAAALGLLLFHRFNAISVAFIPLFVGLGIDFAIQFAVRFRAEQRDFADAKQALINAGAAMGRSLILAAAAVSVGFLAFIPTEYVGVSQLGAIAGSGLFLALFLSLTLLPALLAVFTPSGSLAEGGSPFLARIDGFVLNRRRTVLTIGFCAAFVCLILSFFVRFDFNPIHLRSAKTESVSALLQLARDPDQTPNLINIIAPDVTSADELAGKLRALPEIGKVVTLSSFVPKEQEERLSEIQSTNDLIDPILNPFDHLPPPDDKAVQASILRLRDQLRDVVAHQAAASPAAPDATRLAEALDKLYNAQPVEREKAAQSLVPGLERVLNQMRASLTAQAVSLDTLPAPLLEAWRTADGRVRLAVFPKGDSTSNAVLRKFAHAVVKLAPQASGPPIAQQAAGRVVVRAFVIAGALSFLAITILLFIALRRVVDVVITMTPIVLTGLLMLGSCLILGQPLNFANIIALPLLFGMGVAFHIYFVMSWRAGEAHLLHSSLARAVFFSALSSATGFGALWFSSHPGTSSMGLLLLISLLWTLVSALLFQPALMGAPPSETERA